MNHLRIALVFLTALGGCTFDATPTKQLPEPSNGFSTDAIYPSTSVQDDGANLVVVAALLAKGGFLVLGPGDRLLARVGEGPELVLASQGQTYDPHYVATFASSTEAVDVVLTLDRAGSDDPIITHHVPPRFELDGEPPRTIVSNVGIDVALSPLPRSDDGTYGALLEGTCVPPGTTARVNFLAGKLNLVFADAVMTDGPGSCAATVKVQHTYVAIVHPSFVKPAPSDSISVRERRFAVTVSR